MGRISDKKAAVKLFLFFSGGTLLILTIHYKAILFAAVDDDFLLSPLKYSHLHFYLAIPVMRKQLII